MKKGWMCSLIVGVGVMLGLTGCTPPKPERVIEVHVDLAEWMKPVASSNKVAVAMAAMGVTKVAVGVYVAGDAVIPVARFETATSSLLQRVILWELAVALMP